MSLLSHPLLFKKIFKIYLASTSNKILYICSLANIVFTKQLICPEHFLLFLHTS